MGPGVRWHYDNDGHVICRDGHGRSVLPNIGDGTFEMLRNGAARRRPAGYGCSFFDYDLDGRLDLVVTSYLQFDRTRIPEPGTGGYCQWKGLPVMCGPRGLPFSQNRLFHNEGGGRFADVSMASGIGKTKGCYGFTAVASDFDNDRYPDLYVACDSTPSLLYHNNHDGTFEDIGLLSGTALNETAGTGRHGRRRRRLRRRRQHGHCQDELQRQPNVYHNSGNGTFEDRVPQSGRLRACRVGSIWRIWITTGADLLMINGTYLEADKDGRDPHASRAVLLVGGGKFKDPRRSRERRADRLSSRGGWAIR